MRSPCPKSSTDCGRTRKRRSFTFDEVFGPDSKQGEVYEVSVNPLVERFLEGFNSTALAYGQTGSGKTWSMGTGLDSSTLSPDQIGIVPRAINEIFSILETQRRKCPHGFKYSIAGNIIWGGVKEEEVSSPEELMSCLQRGSLCRATGSTDMNASSSRSHAIFSLTSKFHFVDLAGSERLKRTNAEGDRKREGISINQGLLALGNVISALGDESRKVSHVPYRDSKLTRMLQDSLGGNSQTLMLACISQTVNTLNYANRARNIRNRVAVNQEFFWKPD
ncbi:P-loop containing nucleoside triphosphate hydrolase protein [Chytridium lagenaria]|nr:P-loop containing nucleoside triphosphate hydrolase protein [Chytridium lagenaria]